MNKSPYSKGQSAIEFLSVYTWTFLLLMVILTFATIISTTSRQTSYTPSYCYLEPQMPCYQAILAYNSVSLKSTAYVLITDNLGTPIYFSGNSFSINPALSSTSYYGNCGSGEFGSSNSIICTADLGSYKPSAGAQLNPRFTISYRICNTALCANVMNTPLYNTTGYASTYYTVHN